MRVNGHPENSGESIAQFCQIMEAKLGWGSSVKWRNQDFEVLSQKIFEATNVSLSITTLKRIFGKVRYDSLPNATTLNALAAFIGYENWLEFEEQVRKNDQVKDKTATTVAHTNQKRNHSRRFQIGYALVLVALIIGVLGFVFIRNGHPAEHMTGTGFDPERIDQVVFTSAPVTEGIPNTVLFQFDLSGLSPRNVEIQQSWDTTKRFAVDPGAAEAASTYYLPGYFRAKLLLDGQIVKEHDLFIKSGGWLATLYREPQPRYFLQDELVENGTLAVYAEILEEAQRQAPVPLVVGYHYVDDFGVSADAFTLEAKIQNTWSRGDAICQRTRIVVLGTERYVIIPFSIPGCVGDLNLVIGETVHDGRSHDLTAFGCDFSNMQEFAFSTQGHRATISLNGEIIYAIEYTQDIGRLAGFRFLFNGAGVVDDVKVRGEDGTITFDEQFQ